MKAVEQAARDRALFDDWAAAAGYPTGTSPESLIEAFLSTLSLAPSSKARLLRSLGRTPTARSTVFDGIASAPLARLIAQQPTLRFPDGLRGRRNGWLLVLVGEMGMSRRQARGVRASDVVVDGSVSVCGRKVPRATDPAGCARCAVVRWLEVVGPAAAGDRGRVRDVVDPVGADLVSHSCGFALTDSRWMAAMTLLPAIDRYGWVAYHRPMSDLSVSSVVRVVTVRGDLPAGPSSRVHVSGRFADASSAELAEAYDGVGEQLDAVLLRLQAAIDLAERDSEFLSM